jgi:hypothetical protein
VSCAARYANRRRPRLRLHRLLLADYVHGARHGLYYQHLISFSTGSSSHQLALAIAATVSAACFARERGGPDRGAREPAASLLLEPA